MVERGGREGERGAVVVESGADLADAIARAPEGAELLLGDGTWTLSRPVEISTSLVIRGAGRDRSGIVGTAEGNVLTIAGGRVEIRDVGVRFAGSGWANTILCTGGELVLVGCRAEGARSVDGSGGGGVRAYGDCRILAEDCESVDHDFVAGAAQGGGRLEVRGGRWRGHRGGLWAWDLGRLVGLDAEIAGGAAGGVYGGGGAEVTLERCRVVDSTPVGVGVDGPTALTLLDCSIERSAGNALKLSGEAPVRVERTAFVGSAKAAVYADGAAQSRLVGCTIAATKAEGVLACAQARVSMQDCEIEDAGGSAVVATGGAWVRSERLRVRNAEHGVVMGGAAQVELEEPKLERVRGKGVYVGEQSQLRLRGGDVWGAGVEACGDSAAQLDGTTCRDSDGPGLVCEGSAQMRAHACALLRNAVGIRVGHDAEVDIQGCVVAYNRAAGIRVAGRPRGVVSGCRLVGNRGGAVVGVEPQPTGHSIEDALAELDRWLVAHRASYRAALNEGASTGALAALDALWGAELPAEARAWLGWHDGQHRKCHEGLFEAWSFVDAAEAAESIEVMRQDWESRHPCHALFPLLTNGGGDYIALDGTGEVSGVAGAVVAVYHDDDALWQVVAPALGDWIAALRSSFAASQWRHDDEYGWCPADEDVVTAHLASRLPGYPRPVGAVVEPSLRLAGNRVEEPPPPHTAAFAAWLPDFLARLGSDGRQPSETPAGSETAKGNATWLPPDASPIAAAPSVAALWTHAPALGAPGAPPLLDPLRVAAAAGSSAFVDREELARDTTLADCLAALPAEVPRWCADADLPRLMRLGWRGDQARLLYLGVPDERGEHPVAGWDAHRGELWLCHASLGDLAVELLTGAPATGADEALQQAVSRNAAFLARETWSAEATAALSATTSG